MIILQDTKEQIPWSFEFYPEIITIERHLVTGDYTLENHEDLLTIDRKRNVGEICINVGIEKERFIREMERMSQIKYAYIICEFSIENVLEFPKNSGIPENKWKTIKMGGKYILKTLNSFKDKYGVNVFFCNNRDNAIAKAVEIFHFVQKMSEL